MNGDEQSVNLQQQICRDILGNNDGVIKPFQIIKFKLNLQQQICRDILGNNDGVIKPIQIIKFKLNPVNKSFNTDSVCWYNHQEKVYEVGTIYNAFKCNKCDKFLTTNLNSCITRKLNIETIFLTAEIISKEPLCLIKQNVGLHMIILMLPICWIVQRHFIFGHLFSFLHQ